MIFPLNHPRPPDAHVPCNGCKACCHHTLIMLLPEHGDRLELYDSMAAHNPLTGEMGRALRQKGNGDCAHLGPGGCEVYAHRPAVCRAYDCRDMLIRMGDRHAQRRAIRDGWLSLDIYKAARARLHTLEGEL